MAAAALVAAFGAARMALRSRARRAFSLRKRTVLITGGARGLGLALARAFGDEGARVVLLSRSPSELDRARRDLAARGVDASIAICDVTDAADVRQAIREAAAEMGGLDVVVNNAGVIQMMPFALATDEDFGESIATHFWGPLHVIREALPYLERAGGRVVNISSFGGRVAVPHLLPYCVGKFALTGLSEGLDAELAERGIRVLTVTPGLMRTAVSLPSSAACSIFVPRASACSSSIATSACLLVIASCRARTPFFAAVGSEPRTTRARTVSVNPFADAIISAVVPSAARRSTAAPASSRILTISRLPPAAAHISGVNPRRSAALMAAPRPIRSLACARSLLFAASMSSPAAGVARAGVVAWLRSRPARTTGNSMPNALSVRPF